MIDIKTSSQIETMAQGGALLAKIRDEVVSKMVVGITGKEIDTLATKLIYASGADVSFNKEPDYHWATCIDINDGVVHGIPSDYGFREGDIVGLDIGLIYQGFHSDTSVTVGIGKITPQKQQLLDAGRETLKKAIATAIAGKHISDISKVIQDTLTKRGFSPVAALSGHGVGRHLHEDPLIPCVVVGNPSRSEIIKIGMTLAIEVIYTAGSGEVAYGNQLTADGTRSLKDDGWTIVSLDGKMASAFEESIAVTQAGPRVLTRYDRPRF